MSPKDIGEMTAQQVEHEIVRIGRQGSSKTVNDAKRLQELYEARHLLRRL